jgi:3'-phosphoadenosine 5'-phosphosulfate sulfotransferase (PAPS reductase)/FAD synthetase
MIQDPQTERHVLGISGGKDSAALAIYMKQTRPDLDIDYFFCDTEKELPETYEFLANLEGYLGKSIDRLNARFGFDHWLKVYGGLLPSSQMRWCTRQLKIKPFEEWVGDRPTVSYVGIRFDEEREGYKSRKPNIRAVFPFKEDGIT